ncbi:MAG: TIGR03757 family integrating conjugative element protein [Burkholderiales bacterium]|nr:TIGR03757 family integrating conjugative element protein [Burkholderiales bacterium]
MSVFDTSIRRLALAIGLVAGCAAIALSAVAQVTQQTQTGTVAIGAAPPVQVEIFVNSAVRLTHAEGATVYRVDGLQLLEAELSQGLPKDEAQASEMARERMQRMGPALQERASQSAHAITLAATYGINRVPAIVLNGSAIVYGVTDVSRAVALYRQQKATKGQR